MEFKKTVFECKNGIAKITMNSPENLHAIDVVMVNELLALLERCDTDPEVKVVILTGAGKAFSAGGDLGYISSELEAGTFDPTELVENVGKVSLNIKKMSKIVITSVRGAAAGAGANLALSGDFVIASEKAKFVQAFIALGLVPDTGGTYLLSQTIGFQRAFELCATGRVMKADEAKSLGLIYQVCPDEELEEATMKMAKRIASGPTIAYANLKKQFYEANYTTYERYLQEGEIVTQSKCFATEDFKEGIRAFVEKRPPVFQGE